MRNIVSAQWLKENLISPDLVILDASIELSAGGKRMEKSDLTIPGARYFDLKNVFLDNASPLPNTLPKPEVFELECRKLGINHDSKIVVYDNRGIYSSPRAWWLFKVMGHNEVAVLDGGLPNWIENEFRTANTYHKKFQTGDFKANFDKRLVIDFEQVKNNIIDKKFVILDARSKGRFNGTEKEPREHLKSGKIPESVNFHYMEVLANGKFKPKTELNKLFMDKIMGEKELVFSCGSGITACILMLACQIGYGDSKKLYDGSWTEWADLNNLKNMV